MRIPSPLRTAAWAAVCLLAAGGSGWWARGGVLVRDLEARWSGVVPTALVFERTTAEFERWTGETVERTFALRNPTAEPIRIRSTGTTCGCVEAVAEPRWVEPGGEAEVRVRATLDGRYGPQTFRVRVETDEGERHGAWLTLRGTARALVVPRPWRWMAGALEPGRTVRTTIRLDRVAPVGELSVEARGEALAVRRDGDVLALSLEVPWHRGMHFDGVMVRALPAGGERTVEAWIPVVWGVESPLVVDSGALVLSDGTGEVVVRERWPGRVRFVRAESDVAALRIETERIGDDRIRLRAVNTGGPLDVSPGATIALHVEPASMGPVEVRVAFAGADR